MTFMELVEGLWVKGCLQQLSVKKKWNYTYTSAKNMNIEIQCVLSTPILTPDQIWETQC